MENRREQIYFELLGRMIAAFGSAPDDQQPLTTVQALAKIASDYVWCNYHRPEEQRKELLAAFGFRDGPVEPDIDAEHDADGDVLDAPLPKVEVPPIEPVDDVTFIKAERAVKAMKSKQTESEQNGGGMTGKRNAKSAEQFAIKLSERESDLLGLMREHPEMPPKDYAEILDTSIGNIYQLQHSIRKKQSLLTPKKVTNG